MLGLLVDYVADETNASYGDRERRRLLAALSGDLREVADQTDGSAGRVAQALRAIRASQPNELASDPVIEHLDACIEELDRIRSLHLG